MKRIQYRDVLPVEAGAGAFGSFEDFGYGEKAFVVDKAAECIEPDVPLAYVEMAVHAAAQLLLAVVDVKCPDFLNADKAIEFPQRPIVTFPGPHIISRRERVARVQAHTDTVRVSDSFQYCGQLFKSPAEAASLARRVFQQD